MPVVTLPDLNVYVDQCLARQNTGLSETIVFLHGLGSSTKDWQHQRDYFSTSYDFVAIDLRGHGQSGKPDGPYSIDMMANDVSAVLPKLNITKAHLVGLSMGAQVAMQVALDHKAQVSSLTVVNSPANMRPRRIRDKLTVFQRKLLVRLFGMRKVGRVLADRLFPGEEFTDTRRAFAQAWAENDPAAYRASLNAILDWDITMRLPELDMPMLVVAASEDYTPLEWKQLIADMAQQARLVVIEDSRHATPIERPDALNGVLQQFLDDVHMTRK